MKRASLYFGDRQMKKVQDVARFLGISWSELVRRALDELLDQWHHNEKEHEWQARKRETMAIDTIDVKDLDRISGVRQEIVDIDLAGEGGNRD